MKKFTILGLSLLFAANAGAAVGGGAEQQLIGKWKCDAVGTSFFGETFFTGTMVMNIKPDGKVVSDSIMVLPVKGNNFRYKSVMTEKWWVKDNILFTQIFDYNIQRAHDSALTRALKNDSSLQKLEDGVYQDGIVTPTDKALRNETVREDRILELTNNVFKSESSELGSTITTNCTRMGGKGR